MSIISAERAIELINEATWSHEEFFRAFWLKVEGPRDEMARKITSTSGKDEIFAIVVRDSSFTIPNRILSDMQELLAASKEDIAKLSSKRPERLTVVILLKQDFGKAQVSSPILLPTWFPVRPSLETHVFLTDLVGLADGTLLSCPEAQVDRVAELIYNLERALVASLNDLNSLNPRAAKNFLCGLLKMSDVDAVERISRYQRHINLVASPRGYRPNAAQASGSLVSDALRLFLCSNSDDLANAAKGLSSSFPLGGRMLKPSFLGVSLRPRQTLSMSGKNWFSVLVGIYHSYQLMNASAHAGDYGHYPVALIHYSSRDLQAFLEDALDLIT